ncbi:carbohydrate ABC transporter permease [Rhizobium sp. SAFR-030]|uniref:carbohydrate ABC transporter permease n=1 Tax=Rhizobium sp. SAFR-030 TaxID=3387277 RepID=UPI003F7F0282
MAPSFQAKRLLGREARLGLGLTAPVIAVMGGLVILPLVITVFDSFFRIEPMRPGTPFVGFRNYIALMSDSNVLTSWVNTFAYVVIAVTIETVGGLAAALLLHHASVGRRWLLAIVILPWCLPPVVNAIIWLWIYNPSYGLLNSLLQAVGLTSTNQVWFNDRFTGLFLVSVVHAWRMMPLTAIILLAALQSIPTNLYEAARLDGASRWRQFTMITLPLIAGGLAIALSQSTVFAFNLFDEAWILNGSSLGTRSVMIQVYLSAFQNMKFSLGMALSILAMIASLSVSALYVLRVYKETRYD